MNQNTSNVLLLRPATGKKSESLCLGRMQKALHSRVHLHFIHNSKMNDHKKQLIFSELNKCIMTTPFSPRRHFPIFRYGRRNMKMESHHAALHRQLQSPSHTIAHIALFCVISRLHYITFERCSTKGPRSIILCINPCTRNPRFCTERTILPSASRSIKLKSKPSAFFSLFESPESGAKKGTIIIRAIEKWINARSSS